MADEVQGPRRTDASGPLRPSGPKPQRSGLPGIRVRPPAEGTIRRALAHEAGYQAPSDVEAFQPITSYEEALHDLPRSAWSDPGRLAELLGRAMHELDGEEDRWNWRWRGWYRDLDLWPPPQPDVRMMYGLPYPRDDRRPRPPQPEPPRIAPMYGLPIPPGRGRVDVRPMYGAPYPGDDVVVRPMYGLPYPAPEPEVRMMYGMPYPRRRY